MKRSCLIFLVSIAVAPCGRAQQGQRTESIVPSDFFRVKVHVYNYAKVPPAVLARAEKEATTIFSSSGILTVWTNCRMHMDGVPGDSSCELPYDGTDFFLRILPQRMTAHLTYSQTTLGFAVASTERKSAVVNVFYDRIKSLAVKGDPSESRLLALVSAHELGHLLLPTSGHADAGIMRGEWSPEDLLLIRSGHMLFTHEQSKLIQANVGWRMGKREYSDPWLARNPERSAEGPAGTDSKEEYSLQYHPEPSPSPTAK